MTDTTRPTVESSKPDMRGPALVAHHAFRKTLNAYAAQQKGFSHEACMNLKQNPASIVAYQALQMRLAVMSATGDALAKFGEPADVPYTGVSDFLRDKRRMLTDEYNRALVRVASSSLSLMEEEPDSAKYRKLAQASASNLGDVDAWSFAAMTFHLLFDEVIPTIEALEAATR